MWFSMKFSMKENFLLVFQKDNPPPPKKKSKSSINCAIKLSNNSFDQDFSMGHVKVVFNDWKELGNVFRCVRETSE